MSKPLTISLMGERHKNDRGTNRISGHNRPYRQIQHCCKAKDSYIIPLTRRGAHDSGSCRYSLTTTDFLHVRSDREFEMVNMVGTWNEVFRDIPDAEAAYRAYAFDLPTASLFHVMRVC